MKIEFKKKPEVGLVSVDELAVGEAFINTKATNPDVVYVKIREGVLVLGECTTFTHFRGFNPAKDFKRVNLKLVVEE